MEMKIASNNRELRLTANSNKWEATVIEKLTSPRFEGNKKSLSLNKSPSYSKSQLVGVTRHLSCMSPNITIDADTIEKHWKNVLEQVTSIGFDMAVTMTASHSANMNFF